MLWFVGLIPLAPGLRALADSVPDAILENAVVRLNFYAAPFGFNLVEKSSGSTLLQQSANQFTIADVLCTASGATNITATSSNLVADLLLAGTDATGHIAFNFAQPGILQVTLSSTESASSILQQFVDQGEEIVGGFECPSGPTLSARNFSHALAASLTLTNVLYYCGAKAPFYLTTRHYGIYAETNALGTLTFAQDGNTSFSFNVPQLTYDIIYGAVPADILAGFKSRSGGALMPPLWAFDSIWWKDDDHIDFHNGVTTAQGNVLNTADQLANFQIHASAEWIDRPYGTGNSGLQPGWGNMDFDGSFPNPAQLVQDLGARGMKLMLWMADYCWNGLYDEGLANGFLFGTGDSTTANFQNPDAYHWFQTNLDTFVSLGIAGYKIDRGDEGELPDSVNNINNTLLQQLAYNGLNAAAPGAVYNIARCAWDTGRQYVGLGNGDTYATFAGLQYSILSGLRAGILNFPMWGSDTGGYIAPPYNPTEELFARWLEFSAYSPIMEVLVGNSRTPWYDYSQNLVAITRAQAGAHHDLIPYTRSAVYQATQTGLPVMRPLFVSFPDDPNLANSLTNCEYMYGGQILVAPVITAGASSRPVYLPAGTWLNYNDRATVYRGPVNISAPAPLDTIPLFVPAGAIIPRGDIFQGNNLWTPNWSPQLRIEFFPADGVTTSYPYYTGSAVQSIHCSGQNQGVTIQFDDLGVPGLMDVYVRNPGTVTLNGTLLVLGTDYTYNSSSNLLRVPFSGPANLVISAANNLFQTVGLVNGNFESGYTGWSTSGNLQLTSRASAGSTAIQFNPGQVPPTGVLSQSFATTPGQSYILSFDVGADWGTPSMAQSLQVSLAGSRTLLSRTVTVYGPGNSSSLYLSTNYIFTANSTSTTLTFRDVSPTGINIDLLLDNVQINATAAPPPAGPFTNGSFESGYTAWTATGNQQLSNRASQGATAVQFNPGQVAPNGTLAQTFATTPGQSYAVSFDVGADWGTPTTAQSLQVNVSGTASLLSQTVTVYGPGNSSSSYLTTNFTFTADSSAATLSFVDVSPTGINIDLLLDNVQVNLAPPPPPPGPFTNGNFELGYTGWTASGNQLLSNRASSGTNAVEFNPGQVAPNGSLSQTFAVTPGQAYALSFDVGADWGTPSTPQSLQVVVAGNSALLSRTVTVFGPGNSSSLYLSTNFIFTADNSAVTLTFHDVSSTGLNIDLLLDNVQVVPTVPPPPPNAFSNGSFESGYTNWAASGNLQLTSRASQGITAVQFNPGQTDPNGLLSQTFATVPGQTYALDFDVGTDWGTSNSPQALQVTVSGNNTLLSETVTVYGTGNSSSAYISTNFTFAADSASTTLTFQDLSPTGINIDLLLDNVQVNPQPIILSVGGQGSSDDPVLSLAFSGREVLLSCRSAESQSCTIEVSSDLVTWQPLTTLELAAQNTVLVRKSAPSSTREFYRVAQKSLRLPARR